MGGNDELFSDTDGDAPRPKPPTGAFNLGGLFGDTGPSVENVARVHREALEEAADALDADAEPVAVQRPKPVRPKRADGSVDVARRVAESAPPAPVAAPPGPPAEPLTRRTNDAAPPMTEPLQWLTASDIAGEPRREPRVKEQPAGGSSLGGLVRGVAAREVDTSAAVARPSRPIEHARPQPTIRPVEAAPVADASRASRAEPASSTAPADVLWAERSSPAGGAVPVASAPVRAAASSVQAPAASRRGAAQPASRFAMTGRDWAVSLVSLGVTGAAVFGIVTLLR